MLRIQKMAQAAVAVLGCTLAFTASAQIPFTPVVAPAKPSGVNNAFPTQNPSGPTGVAFQANYPYPGQCLADLANNGLFPRLSACTTVGSFASPSQRTGGDWAASGALIPFKVLNPMLPNSVPLAGTLATPKFMWNVINPPDYTPDTATFPGADYYEIGVHEAWGFQAVADAGLFPNTKAPPVGAGTPVASGAPNGMQWTGLICTAAAGCSCPADASASFKASYCKAPAGKIPQGYPLLTPIWGVGQINSGGGPVTTILSSLGLFAPGTPSAWSPNNYVATWPSISIRGTRGRPVIVKWVNEFPNNHVLCPHPEAADWPCAIDRTFMGVKSRVDPALTGGVPPDGVNQFGSPQQPDNSWVTHLHGGEIPPSTDGFAEKWFGNAVTAPAYTNLFVNPPFENPSFITLKRPSGNADVYTYPMVQEEATIWFHDHTLGKTHHNVIAGPAGFFPVKDPSKHGGVGNGNAGTCPAGLATCTSEYTWLDPVTEPRNSLNVPLYDLFLAVQDRSFNDDGSINFSNGLGQVIPLAPKKGPLPIGYSPVTPGVNPQVHPVWVPEYFGDHVLVNGVLWPKNPTAPGWYRLRIVDGSDSRCYTTGFSTILPAPGAKPTNNVPFYVIANDQGYLKSPVLAPGNQFTMCPGERYELLVNFGAIPGFAPGAAVSIYMTNSAPAPFPAGITPYANGSPYAEMNVIMRFDVNAANGVGVKNCTVGASNSWNPNWTQAQMASAILAGTACMPANPQLVVDPNFVDLRPVGPFPPGTIVRQVYMNERADGVTLAPMGMQLNGVPFEYKVTETPKQGTKEVWQFINLTVDAHPMHPHLVSHQVVSRQTFNVGAYKALLCGSTTCQPGTAPGGEMQVVPDVTPLLTGTPTLVTAASIEGGRKDATQVPPGMVTTIIADWTPRWNETGNATAPGSAGCPMGTTGCAAPYVFESVTAGPYVWHCHINSHEDSEMMRTSLVVK
jgi:spore coat protein A, manganese oxidase